MAETAQEKLEALVGRIKKVRYWLLALAVLKVAGLSMIFISAYIGVYAWLDHQVNFGMFGRITAFLLLLAGSAFLLYKLARYLVIHISCSEAANFIESKRSFNQQLVTAVEFYEKQHDYPYSRTLAEQLVHHICKQTEGFKFDSTIDKWQGYVLAAVIFFGLGTVWFYVRANYLFISAYFARLTRPLATVEPLVSTNLQPITRDIVAEPNRPVTFAAEIEGRVPESGKLVLVAVDPNSPDSPREIKSLFGITSLGVLSHGASAALQREEIRILPSLAAGEKAELKSSKSFAKAGLFKYRFEAGSASTEWHQVDIHPAPQIDSLTAEVLLPPRPPRNKAVTPYTEQITDHALDVIPGSGITLAVQATGHLSEATITGLDGQPITKQLGGADQFTFSFTADRSGDIRFRLVDEFGLANENTPDLQVTIRNDEPPKIALISPDGDYIATNVASVPITFELSDDFGLDTAHIVLEIPRQQPRQLAIPITKGDKTHTFTDTIELEQYDLQVGDSILFYAQASDIDTGSALPSRSSSSDVYFIEIRPYRQNWHPQPGGGQGSGAGATPEELLTILEYTRAILKKTWAIADNLAPASGRGTPADRRGLITDEDRGRLEAINNDVQHCATQLATMRDDPQYRFDEQAKGTLNQVLQSYSQASECLAARNAPAAIIPEKQAYSTLRKFILELEMLWSPPSSGQSVPQSKPDSIKLQESPEFSQYEKERIEGEMKELQQKLEKVAREQKILKTDFVNFLEQQRQQKAAAQAVKDEMASSAAQDKQGQTKQSASKETRSATVQSAQKSKTDSSGKSTSSSQDASQGAADSPPTGSGATGQSSEGRKPLPQARPEPGRGMAGLISPRPWAGGTAEGGQPARGEPAENQSLAGVEARLRMLQAKQKALQEKVSQLKTDLQQLPTISDEAGRLGLALPGWAGAPPAQSAGANQAKQKAQEHLKDALEKMDQLQNAVTETRYQSDITGKKATEAVELMESARQQLDQAANAIQQGLSMTDQARLAQKAQDIAEQLAEAADALDESLSPIEREEMLARLEAAKRLLESMSGAQWSTVNKSGNHRAAAHVLTKNPRLAPAETARAMARQFWSIAIEAKKQKSQSIEDEPSDVKFYEMENKFFENAAKFNQEHMKREPASREAK
jgi:hypothetical protein